MSVTARPRMGGRRAVMRWRRVVILVVTDPLWGAGPAYPAEGEGGEPVTRLGSLGWAGRSWVGCGWGERVVRGHCCFVVVDRLCEGGAELKIVEGFVDDDEGLETFARFLGGELVVRSVV